MGFWRLPAPLLHHSMIIIDGSYGEGGGQIIRTCLSLSAITGQEFEILNIRAGRAKPGLQPQHLASVNAAAMICAAETVGASAGSQRLVFSPKHPVTPGDYRFDIGTAGASTLVFQTVFLPLALAPDGSRPAITGGTHVPHSPPVEYVEDVYLQAVERMGGMSGHVSYLTAGFYPRGGGRLNAWIGGGAPQWPIAMSERGDLRTLKAYIVTARLPQHVLDRGAATVEKVMKGVGRKVEIEKREKDSPGPGAAVVLTAWCDGGFAGFTTIGIQGKPMEQVAEETCQQLMKWWKTEASCDERLADQLALPASLVQGESRWSTPRVTEHLRTVLWAVRQFLPIEYALEAGPLDNTTVIINGVGVDSRG